MANQAKVQDDRKISVSVTVMRKSFKRRDKTTIEYIGMDLVNPFSGEDFEVELSPKWKSDKGIFDYKAGKLLQTQSSFTMTGFLVPVTYYSKARKRDVTVVGCFLENPFFSGDIECRISNEEQYSVLAFYCSDAWGIKLSRFYGEEKELADDPEE